MINRLFMKIYRLLSPLLLGCVLAGFSSCLNKETAMPLPPAKPHEPGDEIVSAVSMGSDYKLQIFYNLEKNTVVGSNDFTAWDLGFETSASGWHVLLNTARFMKAYKTTKTDLASVKVSDTVGIKVAIDAPSGSLDSTAFGDWKGGQVYIIVRGYNAAGEDQGLLKVKILSVDAGAYQVQWANMDGGAIHTIEVKKDDKYNLSFLSLDNAGKTLLVEPPKTDWDVVFTKYTHIYYEMDNMPYSVVGCVLNRYKTTAGPLSGGGKFGDIKLEQATDTRLYEHINTIGFDWKTYTGSTYRVDTNKHFIIRNSDGLYFKLRFIGFLDKAGIKGNPAWQYQRL